MIDHLFTITFPKSPNWNCKVLIVDAKSPDGTSEIVKKTKKYPNLDLYVEEKKRVSEQRMLRDLEGL